MSEKPTALKLKGEGKGNFIPVVHLRAASAGGRVSIAVEANSLILDVTTYQISMILLVSLHSKSPNLGLSVELVSISFYTWESKHTSSKPCHQCE